MGVAYSVGEVDHLYTFFVQWSPDMYTNKKSRRPRNHKNNNNNNRYLVLEKDKVDAILGEHKAPAANAWQYPLSYCVSCPTAFSVFLRPLSYCIYCSSTFFQLSALTVADR
ncbi:hypothetical protein NHX12_002029 [Muraenolepis orangiensis]|uniref:Uncharacterized protein n=1 Tax=Muraenolepis orangiensis TaxID=630683 RepID=A0A9Q0E3N6_9TELE|nr:hypothetical protein NHX12_002029 [Muraenolepis orangiensis]